MSVDAVDEKGGLALRHGLARGRDQAVPLPRPHGRQGQARARRPGRADAASTATTSRPRPAGPSTRSRRLDDAAGDRARPAARAARPSGPWRPTPRCGPRSRPWPGSGSSSSKLDIGDGIQVDGWRILPPDFDPAKKYPLLVYVYGEPAGQTVQDSWGGNNYLWHLMLAQQGYVVASFDNRGTPAPRGRAWRKSDLPPDRHPGLGRPGRGRPGGHRRLAVRRPRPGRQSGAGAAAGR